VSAADGLGLLWRRSSSCNPGECVEVAFSRDRVFVRDSKDRLGPILELSRDAWRVFVLSVAHRAGQAGPAAGNAGSKGSEC
jgi:hypothetical protein